MALLFCLSSPSGCAASQHAASPPDTPLGSLVWMTGTWESNQDGEIVQEHWSEENGGTMMGFNRVIVGEETVFFEYLQIVSTPEGVVYRAWPKGEGATSFRLVSLREGSASFSNPAHDFPKTIEYERRGDTLRARASGVENGKSRTSEWVWRRAE